MRRRAPALADLALLLAFALGACGPGRQLEVLVDDLPPEARRLSATISWPGGRSKRATVQGRLDRFLLTLGDDAVSPVTVRIKGLEEGGCLVAEGAGQAPVPGPSASPSDTLRVRLQRTERTCGLTLRRAGDGGGAVVSVPEGWTCRPDQAPCQVPSPPGSTVTLRAVPEAGQDALAASFFTGWAGPCSGRGDCTLEVSEDPEILRVGLSRRHVCQGQWCWEAPLPQGNDLRALWVFDRDDVWAVGSGATILRSYGPSWARVDPGTDGDPDLAFGDNFSGIYATSRDDVWVVGLATVLRWDGEAFRLLRKSADLTESYSAVWGTGPKDVWVVGAREADPLILRWDGQDFREPCPGLASPFPGTGSLGLTGIWGSSAEDVWMVGSWIGEQRKQPAIVHYDHGECRYVAAPAPLRAAERGYLAAVWGSGPTELHAVGGDFATTRGFILRGDGERFVLDGRAPAELPGLSGVWGRGPDDVWFSGDEGTVLRLRGGQIRRVLQDGGLAIMAVHGPSAPGSGLAPSELLRGVGLGGRTFTWDGASWLGDPSDRGLRRVVGPREGGPDEVYALDGSGAVLQRGGASFQRVRDGIGGEAFTDFLFYDPDEKWGATYDGDIYQQEDGGRTYRHLHGGSLVPLHAITGWPAPDSRRRIRPRHLWAVGDQRSIVHCDLSLLANRCAAEAAPASPFPEPYDLYAVHVTEFRGRPFVTAAGGWAGRRRSIILSKLDADPWSVVTTDGSTPFSTAGPLRSIWGTEPDRLWYAGDGAIIGTEPGKYTLWQSPKEYASLRRIFGVDEEHLWVVNSLGSAWRWDGTLDRDAWRYERTGARTFLLDLWGRPGQGLFAISASGSIIHRASDR